MNNMNMRMKNEYPDDPDGWTILFDDQDTRQTLNVEISPQKLVKEAINLYILKSKRKKIIVNLFIIIWNYILKGK